MEISPLGSNHSFPVCQQDYFKRQPNLRHRRLFRGRKCSAWEQGKPHQARFLGFVYTTVALGEGSVENLVF